ncbi:dihydroxyacetone kinase subunit DhaK, partial [Deinococcus sp.]|uniref:dihydroxyacetone kinase subunit DhaK n=1 Tax=Deinococcus sp. TaxID=47478 RepID=UPI00286E307C
KNYSGDIMNFEMAAELADFKCASVIVQDDVALQGSAHATGRRGVMGTVIYEKVLGALAEEGASLETLVGVAQRLEARVASMGVALSSCTVPAAGRPTFTLEDDQIEVGVGIHGEAGRRRDVLRPARELVQELMEAVLNELRPVAGDELLLIVNGMGGTPLAELYLLYHEARQVLEPLGLRVERSLVGNYTTALDMAGASLTVCLLDDEIRRAWDAPVHTAALRWGR